MLNQKDRLAAFSGGSYGTAKMAGVGQLQLCLIARTGGQAGRQTDRQRTIVKHTYKAAFISRSGHFSFKASLWPGVSSRF